jgi:molecular chaperone DnaK
VVATSGLTEQEIARIIAEAEKAQLSDADKKKRADVQNQLEGLIYTSERSLGEFGHMLSEVERDGIAGEIVAAKRAIETGAVADLTRSLGSLERAAQRIGEVMYAAVESEIAEEEAMRRLPQSFGAQTVPRK